MEPLAKTVLASRLGTDEEEWILSSAVHFAGSDVGGVRGEFGNSPIQQLSNGDEE